MTETARLTVEKRGPSPRTVLEAIKALVCGDANPNWSDAAQTTWTRGVIAGLCDAGLGELLREWQPIKDAPRDGSHVLACIADRPFGYSDGKPWPPTQTVVHWFGDGFYTSVNEHEPTRPFRATHWRPLTAPHPSERSRAA